jgi:hypothetical protein
MNRDDPRLIEDYLSIKAISAEESRENFGGQLKPEEKARQEIDKLLNLAG